MLDITHLFRLKYEADLKNNTVTLFQQWPTDDRRTILKVKNMSFNDIIRLKQPSIILNDFGYIIEITDCNIFNHSKCSIVKLVDKSDGRCYADYHHRFVDMSNPLIFDKREKNKADTKINCFIV